MPRLRSISRLRSTQGVTRRYRADGSGRMFVFSADMQRSVGSDGRMGLTQVKPAAAERAAPTTAARWRSAARRQGPAAKAQRSTGTAGRRAEPITNEPGTANRSPWRHGSIDAR